MSLIILILIGIALKRYYQKLAIKNLDEGIITPSDYTLIFRDIPRHDFNKKAFFQYVSQFHPVEKITLAYDIVDYIGIIRQMNEQKATRTMLTRYRNQELKKNPKLVRENIYPPWRIGCCKTMDSEDILTEHITELKIKRKEMEKSMVKGKDKSKFIGVAFVTFSTQTDAEICQSKLGYSSLQIFKEKLRTCCCKGKPKLKPFRGSYLTIERAPEPSDIYWENLNVPLFERFKKTLVTFIMTAAVLAVCFFITFGITLWKVYYIYIYIYI